MLNIIILLKWFRSRFNNIYDIPKSLIKVFNKTIIKHVLDNINANNNYLFWYNEYNL